MAETRRDPMNIGCSHPGACLLSTGVSNVKCGTPLRSTHQGYVVAHPNDEPEFYATAHAESGDVVRAWKSMTIETYENIYRPGDRVDIERVDDYGNLYFRVDPEGPYTTTSESAIYLDTTQWLVRKGIRLAREKHGREVRDLREHTTRDSEAPEEARVLKPPPQVIEGW